MEIIFVVSAIHGGGAERVVATLANHYAKQGDKIIILMVAGDEVAYELDHNVMTVSLGEASQGHLLAQLKRLGRMRHFFKTHRGCRIVSFSTTINMYTIIAALGLKMRVIVSERNDPSRCGYARIRNFIYSFGKGFVFQTEDARACFPEKVRKRGVVIPNPLRGNIPETYRGRRRAVIAAVGRLEPQKNHRLLLEAYAGFYRSHPEYELHIYGKGSLEQELRGQAQTLSVGGSVRFMGFSDRVLEEIKACAMYVLSSDYEGIPNSLMEAMALELPCVATDCPIGGSALCIRNGENGILTPVGDRESLQSAMEWIAENQDAAAKMGKRAGQIRESFSEERIAAMWRGYISGGDDRNEGETGDGA